VDVRWPRGGRIHARHWWVRVPGPLELRAGWDDRERLHVVGGIVLGVGLSVAGALVAGAVALVSDREDTLAALLSVLAAGSFTFGVALGVHFLGQSGRVGLSVRSTAALDG